MALPRPAKHTTAFKRGQAIVLLLVVLVILTFVFLWIVDLHRIVAGKSHAQNAGDAAALMAARWQASTLNLEGELNLMHALALSANDDTAVDAITNMQARLLFTGPLGGLVAAQVVAKNNRVYNDPQFTRLLNEHADDVSRYNDEFGQGLLFPEPYPGAWAEYSLMLTAIAGDGLAAAPDNAQFYTDPAGAHILLDPGFYDAIAGRQWCWFFLNHATSENPVRTILDDFTDYTYFPPLPTRPRPTYENCEIFSIGLRPRMMRLEKIGGIEEALFGAAESQGIDLLGRTDPTITPYVRTNVLPVAQNWYFYENTMWDAPWPAMDSASGEVLPLAGEIKPEYNYMGADAVVRLSVETSRVSTPEPTSDTLIWTAAAKPFGYLRTDDNGMEKLQPIAYGLVLPAFRNVRLIPLDAATSGSDGSFDIQWRRHTDEHLPLYLETGQKAPGCPYCNNLKTFENPAFRLQGSEWLKKNSYRCVAPPPPGPGRGGGTRRGH